VLYVSNFGQVGLTGDSGFCLLLSGATSLWSFIRNQLVMLAGKAINN
jgi:hypothetical protein